MKDKLPHLLIALLTLTSLLAAGPIPARVDIGFDQPIQAIPDDFSGLSFETKIILPDDDGNYLFSPENHALIETFKTLGIKSLRIGGNTAERTSVPVPGLTAIDHLFEFARLAGTRVIYTVRMGHYNPEKAGSLVAYIERNYRDVVSCYIIGNEPDNTDRTYAEYKAQWTRFADTITNEDFAPGARFCAPTTTHGAPEWAAQMAEELHDTGLLKMVGQHYYPSHSSLRFNDPELAREDLVLKNTAERYAAFADTFVPRLQKIGMPYRLNETNSFYGGGAYGASDTYAAALWGLDYLYWWASREAIGLNFHSGVKVYPGDQVTRKNVYTPITPTVDGMVFLPLSYAIKMFNIGSKGTLLEAEIDIDASHAHLLTAYPVLGQDGHLYLTLINKSYGQYAEALEVTFAAPGYDPQATTLTLHTKDNRIGNVHETMINREKIGEDATFAENWQSQELRSEGDHLSINVGPTTAVVIKLKQP